VVEADIAGFADAQQRLRERFGEPAVFLQPPQFTYPPGTPIDPETDRAYDPVLVPTASAQASAAVNVTVAYQARARDETAGPIGFSDRAHVMLIADLADRPLCEGAITVLLREDPYTITAMRPDGIGQLQRWLTYARKGS
jgi:hypothetical protein